MAGFLSLIADCGSVQTEEYPCYPNNTKNMQYNSRIASSLPCLSSPRNYRYWLPIFAIFFLFPQLDGATLQSKTADAFSSYVREVEKETVSRRNGKLPYFIVSESPGNLISLSQDLIVIRNLHEEDDTPKGIIHDWLGATVLKGITLDQALQVLTAYDIHQDIFKEVVLSRLINRDGDLVNTHMRFKIEGLMTIITDSSHEARIYRISDKKAQIFCQSKRINEIENFGEENERLLPEGNDRGLLWRVNSYITLEESSEGVTIECRSLHLTRDIPFGIGLFIGSFMKNQPAESLESMLTALKSYFSKEPYLLQKKEPLTAQD